MAKKSAKWFMLAAPKTSKRRQPKPSLTTLKKADNANRLRRIAQYQETIERYGSADGRNALWGWTLLGYRPCRSIVHGIVQFPILVYGTNQDRDYGTISLVREVSGASGDRSTQSGTLRGGDLLGSDQGLSSLHHAVGGITASS